MLSTVIRENVGALAKTSDGMLVAIAPLGEGGLAVWRGHSWQELPNLEGFTDVLATFDRLYGIRGDQRREVVEITFEGREIPIGEGFTNLMGGRGAYLPDGSYLPHLYATAADGQLSAYRGGGVWEPIALNVGQVALVRTPGSDEVILFGLTQDRQSVLRYDGAPYAWTRVGGGRTSIESSAGGSLLTVAPANGEPRCFDVSRTVWPTLAVPAGAHAPFRRFNTLRISPSSAFDADTYCLEPAALGAAGSDLWVQRPAWAPSAPGAARRTFPWRIVASNVRDFVPMFGAEPSIAVLGSDRRLTQLTWTHPTIGTEALAPLTVGDFLSHEFVVRGGEGPPYQIVAVGGIIPPGMQVLGTRLVGAPETVGNYGLTLTALDAMGNRAANLLAIQVRVGPRPAPAPTPAPKPPAARALGYSQAVVFNCRTGIEPEHPPVTLFRRMLGTIEWRELGELPTSHSGDFCPAPDAKPMIVDLDDGWNELLAVDRTLTFCDGNPASPLCNGGYALVRGDLRGGLYQWNLPY